MLANQQSYARASVRGLFAHKTELPYELAEKIGSYLEMKTASSVAQVSKNPAKQAKDAFDAVDIDNPSLKRFV